MIDIERFVNILIDFIGLAKQCGTQCLRLQTESLISNWIHCMSSLRAKGSFSVSSMWQIKDVKTKEGVK